MGMHPKLGNGGERDQEIVAVGTLMVNVIQ